MPSSIGVNLKSGTKEINFELYDQYIPMAQQGAETKLTWRHIPGDLSNENYWYNRAGKQSTTESLELELNNIIKTVFI